jgi:hypothetical protein
MLAGPGYDVLGGREADGTLALGRRDVAIVRRDPPRDPPSKGTEQ